jgi:hypothetical protein
MAQCAKSSANASTSILALLFDAVMSDDTTFHQFTTNWINSYLGTKQGESTMRISQGPMTTDPKSSKVEAVIKSLATNIGHLVTKTPTLHNPTARKDDEKGQDFGEDKVATLMGYCCVDKDTGVPAMWYEGFSKTKNPDVLRYLLKDFMKKWSRAHDGVKINGAVNFSK